MPTIGGVQTETGELLPVATRTRRKGLKMGGTARASGATSLASTVKALQWDKTYSSTEVPVQVRFRTGNAHRIFSELGSVGSNATARLLGNGGSGSTVYTSTASATWSEWENVYANYVNTGASCVLCYIAGKGGIFRYEVLTMPICTNPA